MKRAFTAAFVFVAATIVSSQAYAVCNDAMAKDVRSSNLDDQGKLNMLRAMGCYDQMLESKDQARRDAYNAHLKQLESEAAKRAADREDAIRKNKATQAAAIEADNARRDAEGAQRDAFEQAMANKCGEYPLDLTIGLSEKLLKMGCAGPTTLQLDSAYGLRIYKTPDFLVTTRGGKVVS